MTNYCCVPGCRETGGFKFPKDPALCRKWQIAVRRETKNKKLWKPSVHSVVCAKHFQTKDFIKSNLERLRQDLVSGAIPSVFDFKKKNVKVEKQNQERQERVLKRGTKRPCDSDQTEPIHELIAHKLNSKQDVSSVEAVEAETFIQVDLLGMYFLKH